MSLAPKGLKPAKSGDQAVVPRGAPQDEAIRSTLAEQFLESGIELHYSVECAASFRYLSKRKLKPGAFRRKFVRGKPAQSLVAIALPTAEEGELPAVSLAIP